MKQTYTFAFLSLVTLMGAALLTGCPSSTGNSDDTETSAASTTATAITLSKSTSTLAKGDSFTLTATVTPSTVKTISWASSNTTYVTVSGSGTTATVTAVKAALNNTTTVTITATAGSHKATCKVTVTGLTVSATLSDSNATDNAKLLFQYLTDYYGKQILAGQMENAWNNSCDMLDRVYSDVSKYPALMGFDFMNYTGINSYTASNCQTERAIKFWNGQNYSGTTIAPGNHGIVAFMWHWRDPDTTSSSTGTSITRSTSAVSTDGSFNTEANTSSSDYTTYTIPYDCSTNTWNTSSTSYTNMVSNLDTIATQLAKLQTAGIPVLWRPIHEAAGNVGAYTGGKAWFWWGNSGDTDAEKAESYIALWKFMYTYFTSTKKLHNLIWVWNGQNADYYPGDAYVDIIGDDIYASDHTSQLTAYTKFSAMSDDSTTNPKIVSLTECGRIPLPASCSTDGAWWRWFMVWNDGNWDSSTSSVTTTDSTSNFWSGSSINEATVKSTVYSSSMVITLDELPDLTSYSSSN